MEEVVYLNYEESIAKLKELGFDDEQIEDLKKQIEASKETTI